MASKTKIYIVLELVNGGELFDKIVSISNPYTISLLLTLSLYLIKSNGLTWEFLWSCSQFSTVFTNVILGYESYNRLNKGDLRRMKLGDMFSSSSMPLITATVEGSTTEISRSFIFKLCTSLICWYLLCSKLLNLYVVCLLQPENLLLDANGVLKVSDFGLSAFSLQVRVSHLVYHLDIMANEQYINLFFSHIWLL